MKHINFYINSFATAALALLLAGCANDDVAQNNDNMQNGSQPSSIVTFTGGIVDDGTAQSKSFVPLSRASIKHSVGNGAIALWSTGDKIWVKDAGGTFRQSAAGMFNAAKTRGVFTLDAGTYSNGCQVNYVGNSTSGTQVTIAATQTQSAPNNFDHAGVSGDCGTAFASGNGTAFSFKLDHKAAYLCLLPRSTNEFVHRSKLTKIEIISNNIITGTYNMADDGTLTLASGGSKTITITTGSGFLLNNTATDADKCGLCRRGSQQS